MDPSLRVAANDPHLVSLGGGRLSTAVTIHYISIGTTTVGSSTGCAISLNGPGIKPLHCTIYRNNENQVCMEPEQNARTLIDGRAILHKTNLSQGAMITIGNSYYLRFNNPQEAQLIKSVIGSKEDGVLKNCKNEKIEGHFLDSIIDKDLDSKAIDAWSAVGNPNDWINTNSNDTHALPQCQPTTVYNNLAPADINSLQCPKVFTADSVTVNMPAKDVLGQKYVNFFAKNLIENHRNEKNIGNALLNNQVRNNNNKVQTSYCLNDTKFINIPNNCFGASQLEDDNRKSNNGKTDYLVKVNNSMASWDRNAISGVECYPKPASYGNFQACPLNGINLEMNNDQKHNENGVDTTKQNERLEDMLKICSEYADRQSQHPNNALTLSPIVQNRIKTNGSLPREKKSPFNYDFTNGSCVTGSSSSNSNAQTKQQFVTDNSGRSPRIDNGNCNENYRSNYEVREIHNSSNVVSQKSNGYENVIGIGKYTPQSPRTMIRTTCLSPKREHFIDKQFEMKRLNHNYEQLIKTFEEKFHYEIQAIEECTRSPPPLLRQSSQKEVQATSSLLSIQQNLKKPNKNINNLTLNLMLQSTPISSPEFRRKPIPAPRTLQKTQGNYENRSDLMHSPRYAESDQLKFLQSDLIKRVNYIETQISDLQKPEKSENSTKLEEKSGTGIIDSCNYDLEDQLQILRSKMHRLEAQRNATRVIEENKQAKLKQSIEMKQDQLLRLKRMLEQNPSDICYKEELLNVGESLENDRKAFEDLEFQYLEEESEWHAYCEEVHVEEKALLLKIEEKRLHIEHSKNNDVKNSLQCNNPVSVDQHNEIEFLNTQLVNVLHELQKPETLINTLNSPKNMKESDVFDKMFKTESNHYEDDSETASARKGGDELKIITDIETEIDASSINQSLFGSTEIIYSKSEINTIPNVMSRSVNENMLYNSNNIELPSTTGTDVQDSSVSLGNIKEDIVNNDTSGLYKLSMGYDNYKVNTLERKVPSQDDIDRILKLTDEAPISTKNPTTKIFDSIKEIEKNRQLLLTQQGHHVIEHERQKLIDLKKKINNEAKAQYLSKINQNHPDFNTNLNIIDPLTPNNKENIRKCEGSIAKETHVVQRHSNPELERNNIVLSSNKVRPLSEANSEIICETSENTLFKSGDELSSNYDCHLRKANEPPPEKRSNSANSSDLSSVDFNGIGVTSVVERKKHSAKYQRPLTRYLPISSPDLNLRKHIESAGHQISLCPHIFVDSYSCRGYLHKLGATFHGWSRRWFVLDRQCSAFIYYIDKSEKKPRGGAYFATIDEVYFDHLNVSKSSRPHCTFIVKTKKRTFHLQAASSAAARIWIDALITGAQGNFNDM